MSEEHVLLLHGLFRTRFSLLKLQRSLEDAGYKVTNKSYPSTRRGIPEHAATISEQLRAHFDEERPGRLHIVTHSLGGIVARALMAGHREELPRLGRVVMLAPPNQGAQIVEHLKDLWLFKVVAGRAGRELARDEEGPAEDYGRFQPPEDVEIGIIAGGKGDDKGYARWLKGDNDGTVEVSSTYLKGARDHILLPHIHTFIMNAAETIENTLHFLEHGRFKEEAQRLNLELAEGA